MCSKCAIMRLYLRSILPEFLVDYLMLTYRDIIVGEVQFSSVVRCPLYNVIMVNSDYI